MSKRFTHTVIVMPAFFLLPLASIAQKAITGRVLSRSDQTPVPGVSIVVKGTHTGTSRRRQQRCDPAALGLSRNRTITEHRQLVGCA